MGNRATFHTGQNWIPSERAQICCRVTILGALALLFLCAVVWPEQADEQCASLTTLTNGTTADANQVMNNFNAINNGCAPVASPSFTGTASISGSAAGYVFSDRTNTGNLWEWFSSGNTAGLYKSFNTAGTVMSIDQNGNVGIGAGQLQFGSAYAGPIQGYSIWRDTVNQLTFNGGTSGYQLNNNGNTANLVTITDGGDVGIGTTAPTYPLQVNGNALANSWQTPSDARLKKNIAPISGALDMIQRLKGVRFEWRKTDERRIGKSLGLPTDTPQIGFIAQDVRTVLPEVVSVAAGSDALMSIQESKIVPVLVEAVKELKAANDSEFKEIAALKGEIAEIKRERGIHTANN